MNVAPRISSLCSLLLLLLAGTASYGAEAPPYRIRVAAILGQAQFSRVPGQYIALGPGLDVREGDTIQTASDSAIDLDFGPSIGTLRLTESAVLTLEKVSVTNGSPAGAEVLVQLKQGELLGNLKNIPASSRFEIKVATGLAQVVGGRFRISEKAYLVVLEGQTLFAHIPPVGEPVAHSLKAPPPAYFSPAEGVRPAPKKLVREVEKQNKARLPRR